MSDPASQPLDLRTASTAELLAAMSRGVRHSLARHKRIGNPIVVWDRATGKSMIVPPEQIPDDPAVAPGQET